ncbi:MAG: ketoacyl-ACP synthase III [Saprospiraceae bacterium]|jgi:3-oxoacyl-[acyl-carrier-protein] synthase-3|nr:ketoacyl-ACP synthase III [Saprospiraceae bacterium]
MSGDITVAITGIEGYVPDDILTNKDLETLVDTNDAWIMERVGIRERRILKDPDKAAAFMGAEAVKGLLKKTNTNPDDVELLICATVTGDYVVPDTANQICKLSGINHAYGFDLNAACSGFLFALATGTQFVKSGMHRKVIVVGSDKMSTITDYTDRSTCILFGDGAGAVLLEPSLNDFGIEEISLHGDAGGKDMLRIKSGGSLRPPSIETVTNKEHYVWQDGKVVFKAAVKGMAEAVKEVISKAGHQSADIDWIVPHQANQRIIKAVAEMLDFPLEKVMINIHKYGNTTAATIPLCLWEYESKLKEGDKLVLTAFGGGYTWGAILLTWAYDGKKQ